MPAPAIRTIPYAVITRFTHLGDKLLSKAADDEEFSSLCNDYCSVVMALKRLSQAGGSDWDEFTALKSSLEVEILERLSR